MSDGGSAECNRVAWNQTAEYHRKATWASLVAQMKDPAHLCFDAATLDALRKVDPAGKDVIQFCCNNGRETISVKRMGARRCLGIDISDNFIAQAHELARLSGTECEFIRADSSALPKGIAGAFDIALITVGVFGWMEDLGRFCQQVASSLKPGGTLLVHEMHPLLDMYSPNSASETAPVESYFRTEPFVETTGIDYLGKESYKSEPTYWFPHTLGGIVTSLVEAGLEIRELVEKPEDISAVYAYLEQSEVRLPLSYVLFARKKERSCAS